MCLIALSHRQYPELPLVLVANRDEFHGRPTRALDFWSDAPDVLGGRDLQAGGSWLAVHSNGRFAAVTNYREVASHDPRKRSRGELIERFVCGQEEPGEFGVWLEKHAHEYNLLNLLYGNRLELHSFGSKSGRRRQLPAGLYGLSNAELDDPWPKLVDAKAGLANFMETKRSRLLELIDQPGRIAALGSGELPDVEAAAADLFGLMHDQTPAPDDSLPQTGLPSELERMVSSRFISSEKYGTRATTVLWMGAQGGGAILERSFGPGGSVAGTRGFTLS